MAISVFDLFKVGIGPSSSHTVGPMRAANRFANCLRNRDLLASTAVVRSELFGSLGATGRGHGSDIAIMLGLEGSEPDTVDTDSVAERVAQIRARCELNLVGEHLISFVEKEHLILYRRETLPYHPNGMRFTALDQQGNELFRRIYYSVGGGFVVNEEAAGADRIAIDSTVLPYTFHSAKQLLELCRANGMSISQLMLENEKTWRSEEQIRSGLLAIWDVMQACVRRGSEREGVMPGGLHVKRRAAELYRKLVSRPEAGLKDPLTVLDWVSFYALAVNEENATGGRVVTAPTNGAAGIVPAVLHY